MIKFMYNGIKINGKLIKGFWSKGNYRNGAIFCVYARGYFTPELKEFFKVENDTDIMTDYFETDSIYFSEKDKYIKEVENAYLQQEIKNAKRAIKRLDKIRETNPAYFERYYQTEYERFKKLVA